MNENFISMTIIILSIAVVTLIIIDKPRLDEKCHKECIQDDYSPGYCKKLCKY